MAYEAIQRKNLYQQINNLQQRDWKRCAGKLGLLYSSSFGHGSHNVIWDPKDASFSDPKFLISTVPKNLYKEANQGIFKNILKYGIQEDEIWKALGKLK